LDIQVTTHPINRWVLVPIRIAGNVDIEMVLDTGSPMSTISAATRVELQRRGLLRPVEGEANRFRLVSLTIQGQPIEDLTVRVSPVTTRAGAAGTLGLDFLNRFELIQFHVPTLRLTLT
jgi:hypothetical protein